MLVNDEMDLYSFLYRWLMDPEWVETIRRALAMGVVMDTWMNGEEEEHVSAEAEALLTREEQRLTARAIRVDAIFPEFKMSREYVHSVFHEVLFSTALFVAQKRKGRREVEVPEVEEAIARLARFIEEEPQDLTAVGALFSAISSHEDLNAIAYYGRMLKEDFLLGRLHRPWSKLVLSAQLEAYQQMGLVECVFAGEGDMLQLTELGRDVLERLRRILEESGEINWRADNQRWVIFGETDYDQVFGRVFPDAGQQTRSYLESLGLQPGMRVLEIGCGTGRATVDLGLCDLVGPTGQVVALDPSAVLLQKLEQKCRDRGIQNVEVVQGVAEDLPFPADSFDAAVAVISLHFTDVATAVSEMTRVTRPTGLVSAVCPPPEFDFRVVPMVAMWFRPLSDLAERFGVSFGERTGLPRDALQAAFEAHLSDVDMRDVPGTVSSEDYQSFLTFVLRGGAFFQNILCRLPYHERWGIIRRLEEDGARIAAATSEEEQRGIMYAQAAYGRVPSTSPNLRRRRSVHTGKDQTLQA